MGGNRNGGDGNRNDGDGNRNDGDRNIVNRSGWELELIFKSGV